MSLGITPVNSTAVNRPAFAWQQDTDTATAIPNPPLRNLLDPLFEVGLIGALAKIVIAGSFRPEQAADPAMLTYQVLRRSSTCWRRRSGLRALAALRLAAFGSAGRHPVTSPCPG